MSGLIILLLIAAGVVFAVFFLIFKLIWMMFKKEGNKWPLIWSGVCTVAFCAVTAFMIGTSVYKIVKPFTGMIEYVQKNPAPVYGEHVYTDPDYHFSLDVFNGMYFSDWINIKEANLKAGIDTNVFRNTNNDSNSFTLAGVLRLPLSKKTSVQAFKKGLSQNKDRRLEVHEAKNVTLHGLPGYYVRATIYSNRGEQVPGWLSAVEKDGYVYYVAVIYAGEQTSSGSEPETTVKSIRFETQE